jgi:hypothetical protein
MGKKRVERLQAPLEDIFIARWMCTLQREAKAMASESVEYTRRLYDDVRTWYSNADTKAQVVLAIDGGFLAFLTNAIFAKPEDLKAIVALFSSVTWMLLILTTLSLVLSIISAIVCLWSRVYSPRQLRALVEATSRGEPATIHYVPQLMWFFQIVGCLDQARFRRTLEEFDASAEIKAMASQIHILGNNVRAKHRAVNAGFLLAATTLILFLASGLSYLAETG